MFDNEIFRKSSMLMVHTFLYKTILPHYSIQILKEPLHIFRFLDLFHKLSIFFPLDEHFVLFHHIFIAQTV